MKVLITKASDDYWYSFANFETFDDLASYKENAIYALTVTYNLWYKEDVEKIFNAWSQEDKDFTMKDAYSISECKYEILIEDDYH